MLYSYFARMVVADSLPRPANPVQAQLSPLILAVQLLTVVSIPIIPFSDRVAVNFFICPTESFTITCFGAVFFELAIVAASLRFRGAYYC